MRESWLEAPWTVRVGLVVLVLALATRALLTLFTQQMGGDDLVYNVVTGVLGVVLVAAFASRLLAGRRWARIVLTVLVAIGVVVSLLDIAVVHAFGPATLWLNLPNAVSVVLLWLPASNRHFR
jgi:hypothetical protein